MAPSRKVFLAVVPFLVACNAIIGLSDYKQGECSGGGSCTDARADTTVVIPDTGTDVVFVDAGGTAPVSWARWHMPNYLQDGSPEASIQSYAATDGGWYESVSKLTWREPAEPGTKTFSQAQQFCAGLGDGKWRLPTRIELVTLLDLSQPAQQPTIDPKFATTLRQAYWTTSEVRPFGNGAPRQHWTVDFAKGGLDTAEENDARGVRCIKAQ